MAFTRIQLGLRLGGDFPRPAPGDLMRALRAVEFTQSDMAPNGFQLAFHVETGPGGAFTEAANALLRPMIRVMVRISVDGSTQTLADGYITHRQFVVGDGPEDSYFLVTGEDMSLLMDQREQRNEFPAYNDYLMAGEILLGWASSGVLPETVPVPSAMVPPTDHMSEQWESDRAALQRLAERNGCVFYVHPGPGLNTTTAYWGPPPRVGPPAVTLNVGLGPASNVESFQATYDSRRALRWNGSVLDTDLVPVAIPVVTLEGLRQPPLANRPALSIDSNEGRTQLWLNRAGRALQSLAAEDSVASSLRAQALTDRSTDDVLRAVVEVEATRLGVLVNAPGVVAVRGAGSDHDGVYYLQAATHRIELVDDERWDYRQSLVLTREGVGSTVAEVPR